MKGGFLFEFLLSWCNLPLIMNEKNDLPENGAENEWMELVKTAFWAVLLAVCIRSVIAEPFNIPSGSMKPNLLVGDYLFVSKYTYGYSRYSFPMGLVPLPGRLWGEEPKRGDVAVFKLPADNKTDYIKRVIGMPGDQIQVRGGQLYINGDLTPREFIGQENGMFTYKQTLPNGISFKIYEDGDSGPLDNTRIYTVPERHYFMMGDNRDNSQDSRVPLQQNPLIPSQIRGVGTVPYENLIGKAEFLFFSTNGYARLWEFWKWPWTIRYDRMMDKIR